MTFERVTKNVRRELCFLITAIALSAVAACGGGGGRGGNGPANSTPTVSLAANPTSLNSGQSTTLTWSSTSASSCLASEGWSGSKATSGTEQLGPLNATTTFVLTCTGSGRSASQMVTVTVTPLAGTVTVSGRITFDRVSFKAVAGTGLNPLTPVESPARHVVVEAIDASTNAILASTTTDGAGDYVLAVAMNRNVFIRVKAQMQKTGTAPVWNFRVLNNTNSDALYVLNGSAFNTGTANSTRNLRAPSGWGTTSYTGDRAAAPFAILDAVYKAKELILTANSTTDFGSLDLYWSTSNRPTIGGVCPDNGDIGTSFYIGPGAQDECPTPAPLPPGIYVLGDFAGGNGDTDEFDQHVIAHEFGHYVEDRFSRSDSIGGDHGSDDRLDLRVAFGEGWGNAYSAMANADPAYRDSDQGINRDGGFNLETDRPNAEGWFSEASAGEILWDVFDNVADSGDNVALGFAPIYAVLTGAQASTDALTSIFPFATAIRSANASASAAIGALLSGEQISGTDAFGTGEANDGGDASVLPVYTDIGLNAQTSICTRARYGSDNKLENRKFLRFVNSSTRNIVVTVTGVAGGTGAVAATDPDVYVYRRGVIVTAGVEQGNDQTPVTSFPAATYVIEVLDYDLNGMDTRHHCMTVAVTGN